MIYLWRTLASTPGLAKLASASSANVKLKGRIGAGVPALPVARPLNPPQTCVFPLEEMPDGLTRAEPTRVPWLPPSAPLGATGKREPYKRYQHQGGSARTGIFLYFLVNDAARHSGRTCDAQTRVSKSPRPREHDGSLVTPLAPWALYSNLARPGPGRVREAPRPRRRRRRADAAGPESSHANEAFAIMFRRQACRRDATITRRARAVRSPFSARAHFLQHPRGQPFSHGHFLRRKKA